ncbi:hypothetical protein ADIAG_00668 [Paeniglutamicibacter gangotriensis Lz1y]|uniref:Uncharacterized protein n=1 Tax=Paeniglutamicibacter gangotriensis Lz1y TaxID=1276920 RepID=M7NM01_9MICC|nr:hypothetical protein ADIAG_00668 [Paeniglutamicibacter gangotriensis Lz1y]
MLTILDVKGDSLRIGFKPRGIKGQRAETLAAVTGANQQATAAANESAEAVLHVLLPAASALGAPSA